MARNNPSSSRKWLSIDLHLHTPASNDYQEAGVTYLDILNQAEARGLDIIAFTDHNTVAGYRQMMEEIRQLELLESLNRIQTDEKRQLEEYRRLLHKILLLPGFEFTATFGFHILGIFPENKPIREIEHLLLDLNIPGDQLDFGSATVGATSDVLSAYRVINQAGGLAIAAHANSTNGVAMRGFSFGGQTKIAYTQDPNLHALEVTDLTVRGRQSAAGFFSGTKPEYPRRMHCIQGSDAHRLYIDPVRKKNLGVGDRVTEVLLPEASFAALKELFMSNDFARTRPRHQKTEPVYDFVRAAQDEGPNIIQDFHPQMTVRGGYLYTIIADICAFANTNGGTLYVGIGSDKNREIPGIARPPQVIDQIEKEISNRISPPLHCTLDIHDVSGKKIVRILVPNGGDPPYAVDDNKIYVRSESETGLAVRDEIVELVRRGHGETEPAAESTPPPVEDDRPEEAAVRPEPTVSDRAPKTGVEVVAVDERNGVRTYTLRDLRNGNVVKNVTHSSARRLWHYALQAHDKLPNDLMQAGIQWEGDFGLVRHQKQGKLDRYDLIQRTGPDVYRMYYGVTEDGIHGEWSRLVNGVDE
ncbi:MAG TPA: RNA-binding domain-containing protein [Anaerolineales bacterium]|nr:RNA-binding domain-containing protein [Anaerolineales bacterium]